MSHLFTKDGHFCVVEKEPSEVYERFMLRGYSIVSQKPKKHDEYDKYVLFSRYLSNIKYLGCIFNKSIHDICNTIEKKIFI